MASCFGMPSLIHLPEANSSRLKMDGLEDVGRLLSVLEFWNGLFSEAMVPSKSQQKKVEIS